MGGGWEREELGMVFRFLVCGCWWVGGVVYRDGDYGKRGMF